MGLDAMPRLPLLRRPQNWREFWVDGIATLPLLFLAHLLTSFSLLALFVIFVSSMAGSAFNLNKRMKEQVDARTN